MNQNDKNSESSKRIKSLNQIYIPLKNKDSFPSLNGRRRNSHNYNFSIHEPLSPLTTHSSFIVPGSNGKHAGDASSDIKSKLSKETLTVNKEDPPRMPSPLRINTEKGYFLKEDNNSAHHNHNKRSNSLNSNSNSIKNDISGIFSGGGFANVKIPVQRYSSIDSLNNILEDSNSEVNTPIYPQPLRRGGERDTTLTHAYYSNPNLSNNKTQIPRNGLSSQQLQQLQQQQQQGSLPLPVGASTPVAFSPSHYNSTATTATTLHHSPSQIPVHTSPAEKKSILLNNDYSNTYYDNNPTIDNPFIIQKYSPTSTHVAGWILLFFTYIVFVIGMYSVVISRFISDTGNPVLDGIKHDTYYCYLIPLSVVIVYLFIFINWFSMKFFRHN